MEFLCVGTDVGVLMQWFREEGGVMTYVLENVQGSQVFNYSASANLPSLNINFKSS